MVFHFRKKKSGNNIALFYVSHIRNRNFIAAMLLFSKALAINQGDAMAPWPLFQFSLNCLYQSRGFWWPGLHGHIFPKFNFSRWLSDCEGQPSSLGESFQSPFCDLKTIWRIRDGIKQTNLYIGIMLS